MSCGGCGTLSYFSVVFMGALNKTVTNPTHTSRCPYQDSTMASPEHNKQAQFLATACFPTVKFVRPYCNGHVKEFWLLSLLSFLKLGLCHQRLSIRTFLSSYFTFRISLPSFIESILQWTTHNGVLSVFKVSNGK